MLILGSGLVHKGVGCAAQLGFSGQSKLLVGVVMLLWALKTVHLLLQEHALLQVVKVLLCLLQPA